MLQQAEHNAAIELLEDRRSNPFIRTRQRRTFDRRKSHRVGLSALTFIQEGDKIHYGTLRDISDSGAHLELNDTAPLGGSSFTVGIPFLGSRKIACEPIWSECNDTANSQGHYGIKFVDLSIEDKNELRKRFLLNDMLVMSYADEVLGKAESEEQRQEIKTFFLVDVRSALEDLIDIDTRVAAGESEEKIMDMCSATLDTLVDAGDRLDAYLNQEYLIKEIKSRVRSLLGHFLYQSTVFKRGFEKPHGYPGDYQMLEIVYNNVEVSDGIGKYIDRYGLNVPYSTAIRLRKDMMRDILYDFINRSTAPALKIMNLASGACRDIREMLERPITYQGKVDIICIDQDDRAINYSHETLSALDSGNVDIHLVKGNILKLDALDVRQENGFDMIYSIGIADYLQERMLRKIFHDSYEMLKPGGKLVVAYKDKDRHKPVALNWYGDWYFVPRNEEELIGLIHDAVGKENVSIEIERENSGVIFFAVITKIK